MNPLSGIRVLELSSVIAGPFAGSLLRLLGAEVVKLEVPDGGDAVRKWVSPRGPLPFVQINAGKQSVAINFGTDEGVAVVKKLIPLFDVLTHNSRPGRMERLGLSGSDCLALNPRLVYLGMSGFGSVGPMATRPAYDSIGQAFSGLLGLLTPQGERPSVGPALADMSAGIVCLAGVLAGLVSRERTGRGTVVETSLAEGAVALIADQFAHLQGSGHQPDFLARSRVSQIFPFESADGRYVLVHISTSEKFFRSLARVLGREDLIDDERFSTYDQRVARHEELHAEFGSVTRKLSLELLVDALSKADVPHSPVPSLSEVMSNPQFEALGLFNDVEDRTGLRLCGAPWRFDGVRPGGVHSYPLLGEHTEAVLSGVLSSDELTDLRGRGIIRFVEEFDS